MRTPVFTRQFQKDLARIQKRGWDVGNLKELIQKLLSGAPLEARYNDHPLKGNWVGRRDAHIGPDWILIYAIKEQSIIFERTGSHADLF
jgi:mRNA interferase YafQ